MTTEKADRNAQILEEHRSGAALRDIAERHGISGSRVSAIISRYGGRRRSSRPSAPRGERVRLRIGNLAKAVLVTGQAYQDPKDALNEFVSNAADEYAESGRKGERIRVLLRRKGKAPVVAIDDVGRGMAPDRLRDIARNLFESTKAGDDRTLGEKAIGLLAFQQLGGRCDIVSRADGSDETWTLRLDRGCADASLSRERRRARQVAGTTVYVSDLEPEVLRVLTQRKVVEYLRRRRGAALARGDYAIEVVEGRSAELVTPEEPEGVRLPIAAQQTLWGRIEFALYVAPDADRRRQVAVVGRAGTTIIDNVTELDELDHEPWTVGHVSGQIVFEALQQSAGRRAVLRDRDAFPIFREAVGSIEPLVARTIERVRVAVDQQTADRMSDTLRKVFGRVLKELADLENPMRTPVGSEPGEGGLFEPSSRSDDKGPGGSGRESRGAEPTLSDLDRSVEQPPLKGDDDIAAEAAPDRTRSRALPSVAVDPEPGHARSRFDADTGTVLYNDHHADYLLVKDDERSLLDYLATLIAKEYVIYNNPRSEPADLGEELVRVLVRVRRHLLRSR